jgi:ABC-type multidrug transport system ATPase subunit
MRLYAGHCSYEIDKKLVVDGLSLDLCAGEIVSLIGANGAGKTSLLRMMAGELKPSSGEVYLEGSSLSRSISKQERVN